MIAASNSPSGEDLLEFVSVAHGPYREGGEMPLERAGDELPVMRIVFDEEQSHGCDCAC